MHIGRDRKTSREIPTHRRGTRSAIYNFMIMNLMMVACFVGDRRDIGRVYLLAAIHSALLNSWMQECGGKGGRDYDGEEDGRRGER